MQTKRDCLERQKLRQKHLLSREQMQDREVAAKSRKICERLRSASWYEDCSMIFGYYPLGHEADCRTFLEQALLDEKIVALPRTGEACAMEFFQITSFNYLKEGRFHVMEPDESCTLVTPKMNQTEIVVLVPGVVFDVEGNRYGYGKGYYDRYFSRFFGLHRFALAYEQQLEQKLSVSSEDVKMHRIYTERAVYSFE